MSDENGNAEFLKPLCEGGGCAVRPLNFESAPAQNLCKPVHRTAADADEMNLAANCGVAAVIIH